MPGPRSPRSWYQTSRFSFAPRGGARCARRRRRSLGGRPDRAPASRYPPGGTRSPSRRLSHRKLQLQRAHGGDDLGQRLAAGRTFASARGLAATGFALQVPNAVRSRVSRRTAEKRAVRTETSGVTLRSRRRARMRCSFSGRTRPHRLPVSGRSHGRHHSRPFPIDPLATRVVGAGHRRFVTPTLRARLDRTTECPMGVMDVGPRGGRSWERLVPAAERRNENDCGTTQGEDPQLPVCFPADEDLAHERVAPVQLLSGDPPRRRVDCARERFSRHAPSPAAAHRCAAFAGARDAARPRRLRDAALRGPLDGPERGAARHAPLLGRGPRRRGGRARRARRRGRAPLRHPGGEGRRGLRRLDRRRDRAARAARAPRRASGARPRSPTSASASTPRTATAA